MISLKKTLTEFDGLSRQLHAAMDCYRAALESIGRHAVEVVPAEAAEHRTTLGLIRRNLEGSTSEETLTRSRSALESELERYSERARGSLKGREGEIRAIIEILAQLAQSITAHSDAYSGRFRSLAQGLEAVAQLDDLAAIRQRLAASATEIRSCAESMHREEMDSVARLQGELRTFRRRLEEAESLAATDSLTGLANRRQAESLMRRKIESGQPFSILLFDLDGFKLVNDRYGHYVGDCLLKAFGKRLVGQFRAGDVVCRWGGDEFLVVLSSGLPDGSARAVCVAERMGGLYAIKSPQGAVNVQISATVGFAHSQPGESAEELFTRADASLYQRKGQGSSLTLDLHQGRASVVPKA